MAAVDVDRLIATLSGWVGIERTLKTGVTIVLTQPPRRSGPDGGTLVIFATITKDGVTYNPEGGYPIVWTDAQGGTSAAQAAESARTMLAELVK